MSNIQEQLQKLEKSKQLLESKQFEVIEKAMKGSNPNDIIAATSSLRNIQKKEKNDRKSMILDPMELNNDSGFGYRERKFSINFDTLEMMSRVPIINSIIRTRTNQVAVFAEPQKNKYSLGFEIRKKKQWGQEKPENLTRKDHIRIEAMTEYIINCGSHNVFDHDDFDQFTRKFITDSLKFDQGVFEVVDDNRSIPYQFIAMDSKLYYLSDFYDVKNVSEKEFREKERNGYLPKYVQVIRNNIEAEFYPWELCFAVRNPQTDIRTAGYGISELEILINTITSILYSDQYNRKFFSQGSAPKGILKISSDINESQLQQFKQNWLSMVAGVNNAWKTPVLEADKAEWIDLQKNNRDMEWSKYVEFLIKIGCSVYQIDPSEIGFKLDGGSDSAPMFENNNSARLKHSKDKGLYPLVKFWQRRINKYVVQRLAPDLELVGVGLDSMTQQDEIDLLVKKVGSYMTVNEIRQEVGLDEVEGGDIIANAVFMQNKQLASQEAMMGDNTSGIEGEETPNPLDVDYEDKNAENPFDKALKDDNFFQSF